MQIAFDKAKMSVSHLAGISAPRWEDNETSFTELRGRLQKSIDFLTTFEGAQLDGSEVRDITLTLVGQASRHPGRSSVGFQHGAWLRRSHQDREHAGERA